ncbi:MAG: NAD(P)/FAD-dependent oxidoreductase [Chloroflexi bacterium]|nr:NAD(P)/FAD-dependent oxidoreductase [Chloroflexota bacterium]
MSEPYPRYVVIGNGIAGTTAAETLRKNDPNCTISLFTDEPYPLYNRVALPPALKLEKPMPKVFMKTVEFHREHNICFYPETRVTEIDLSAKSLLTDQGAAFPFDRLLVATGGTPNKLPVPEADADGVCYFQTYDDTADLLERIAKGRSAVAIGGSYIAYELAEAFHMRGLQVSWLIRGPHFFHRVLDADGGAVVDGLARRHGVNMIYGDSAAHLEVKDGRVAGVVTVNGRHIEADFVGCGLGLHLNHDFLPAEVERDFGVTTNEFLETSAQGVYAAGDLAAAYDRSMDRHYTMGTWASATAHGKVAAINMAGGRQPLTDFSNYTSGLFDSRMAVLGSTLEVRQDLQRVSETIPPDGAGKDWAYRRLFFLEDRLVGAVLIGDMHARVDLIKTIRAGEPVWSEREALLRM